MTGQSYHMATTVTIDGITYTQQTTGARSYVSADGEKLSRRQGDQARMAIARDIIPHVRGDKVRAAVPVPTLEKRAEERAARGIVSPMKRYYRSVKAYAVRNETSVKEAQQSGEFKSQYSRLKSAKTRRERGLILLELDIIDEDTFDEYFA